MSAGPAAGIHNLSRMHDAFVKLSLCRFVTLRRKRSHGFFFFLKDGRTARAKVMLKRIKWSELK